MIGLVNNGYDGVRWSVWDINLVIGGVADIQDIAIDNNDAVWLATSEGVVRFDGNSNWTKYNHHTPGLTFSFMGSIHVAEDNSVWCGAQLGASIAKFNGTSWTTYGIPGMSGSGVGSFATKGNDTWLTCGSSMFHFDGTTWTRYHYFNSPVSWGYFSTLKLDSTGNIWAYQSKDITYSTSGQLLRFDGDTTWVLYDSSDCPSLYYNINTMLLDSSFVWIGAGQGVIKLYDTTYAVYSTSNSELVSNLVYSLEKDKNGNLLIGTDKGLMVYNTKEIHIGTPLSQDLNSGNFTMYPNPADSYLEMYLGGIESYDVRIYSIDGKLVLNSQHPGPVTKLNITHLINGVYTLVVYSGDQTVSKKLVVYHH